MTSGSAESSFADGYEDACGRSLPDDRFAFGDGAALADELASLVADGRKTATTGLLADYDADGEPLPEVGDRSVVLDGAGRPVCVIETREVVVRPFGEVDERTARAEGEGDGTLAYWRAEHERAFRLRAEALDVAFGDDAAVVIEHFLVVYRG